MFPSFTISETMFEDRVWTFAFRAQPWPADNGNHININYSMPSESNIKHIIHRHLLFVDEEDPRSQNQ